MSDMKTRVKTSRQTAGVPVVFTVRDLNRQPATILRACDERGLVRIRTRDGRTYSLRVEKTALQPDAEGAGFVERMQRHHARMKAAGHVPLPAKARARLNEIIAGEP